MSEPAQLLTVVEQNGLEPASAASIKSAFAPLFDQAEEWRLKVANIRVTDASQTREMKLARESRLALREIRIKAEKTRKALKDESLRTGKAIDGAYNILEFLIAPLEKSLLEQEQFVERIEAARKAELKRAREAELAPFGIDPAFYNLDDMPEDQFAKLVGDAKLAHEAKIEAARRLEEERIKREQAEAEERERMRKENERLKREADEREAAIKAERAKVDAERKAAEEEARKERLRLQAIAEAERQKAEAERQAKAKLEAEAKRIQEEARKLEERIAEEKRKAAAAPDMEKLIAHAAAIGAIQIPDMDTQDARTLSMEIDRRTQSLVAWITQQASKL